MDYMIFSILLISITLAVIETVKIITNYILKGKKAPPEIMVLMPLSGKVHNVEFLLRNIIWSNTWTEKYVVSKIIILDLGVENETMEICKKICEDNQLMYFVKPSELKAFSSLQN